MVVRDDGDDDEHDGVMHEDDGDELEEERDEGTCNDDVPGVGVASVAGGLLPRLPRRQSDDPPIPCGPLRDDALQRNGALEQMESSEVKP